MFMYLFIARTRSANLDELIEEIRLLREEVSYLSAILKPIQKRDLYSNIIIRPMPIPMPIRPIIPFFKQDHRAKAPSTTPNFLIGTASAQPITKAPENPQKKKKWIFFENENESLENGKIKPTLVPIRPPLPLFQQNHRTKAAPRTPNFFFIGTASAQPATLPAKSGDGGFR